MNAMPTFHSHTHCQAALAKAQTQAWQRLCLSNRTPKSIDEKEHEAITSGLASVGLKVISALILSKYTEYYSCCNK